MSQCQKLATNSTDTPYKLLCARAHVSSAPPSQPTPSAPPSQPTPRARAHVSSAPPSQPTPRARAHVSSAPPSQPTPRARAHVRCGPALTAPTHAPSRTRTRQLRPALAAPKSPVVPPHAPTLARALAGSSHIQPCTYPTQPWLFLAPAPQYTQDLGRTAPPLSYAARPSSTRVRKLQPQP